jgi:hypothetical protein
MTTYKPIFMRPVEVVTGTNDTIKCKLSGAGSYTSVTIGAGVYSCVFDVIWEFYAQLYTAAFGLSSGSIVDGGDTDGKYLYAQIVFTGAHTILIDQQATARMLGWGFNTSTAETQTTFNFSFQPEYCWIPRFQVANQGRFYRRLDEEFRGKKTKVGTLAGNSTGPTLDYRDLQFNNEKAYNVLEEGATKELYYDGSHTTKNLQYFVNQSMVAQPTVSGNPSPRGFWYAPDWNNVIGDITTEDKSPGAPGASSDDYGIRFDLATNPDLWAFCQFEEAAIEPPVDVGVPTGRELYNQLNMTIHTVSEIPTFAATNSILD